MRRKSKGYTLIELFIIIAVISMLIIIGIIVYKKQLLKGYDGKRKADMYKIKVAVEEYEKDHNCYPTAALVTCNSDGLKPYLSNVPCDPQTGESYFYDVDSEGCPIWFYVFSELGNSSDPDSAMLGCTYGCGPAQATSIYHYYLSSPNAPEPYKNDSPVPPEPPVEDLDPDEQYYGCFSGVCEEIEWIDGKGPECQPNHTVSDCNGCLDSEGLPTGECLTQ